MAFRDYTQPVLLEGNNLKYFTAEEAVKAGQLVEIGADGRSVEPSDADGALAFGFAQYDAAAGEKVSVVGPGCVVRATSGTGSISAGELVASHGATGEEGELASAATGDYTVGMALEDDVADGGDVVIYTHLGGQVN